MLDASFTKSININYRKISREFTSQGLTVLHEHGYISTGVEVHELIMAMLGRQNFTRGERWVKGKAMFTKSLGDGTLETSRKHLHR